MLRDPKNFKMVTENRMSVKFIIREVIEDFINNESDSDNSVKITPDENLGEFSPLELVQKKDSSV
jgi:hypothetical protein